MSRYVRFINNRSYLYYVKRFILTCFLLSEQIIATLNIAELFCCITLLPRVFKVMSEFI
jgi:hypothetical protein